MLQSMPWMPGKEIIAFMLTIEDGDLLRYKRHKRWTCDDRLLHSTMVAYTACTRRCYTKQKTFVSRRKGTWFVEAYRQALYKSSVSFNRSSLFWASQAALLPVHFYAYFRALDEVPISLLFYVALFLGTSSVAHLYFSAVYRILSVVLFICLGVPL